MFDHQIFRSIFSAEKILQKKNNVKERQQNQAAQFIDGIAKNPTNSIAMIVFTFSPESFLSFSYTLFAFSPLGRTAWNLHRAVFSATIFHSWGRFFKTFFFWQTHAAGTAARSARPYFCCKTREPAPAS